MAVRRASPQTRQVLEILLDQGEAYGFALVKATRLPSGSVYPILRRLEDDRLVVAREEVMNPGARRPRHRVHYKLTAEGRRVAREATRDHAVASRTLSVGCDT